MSQHKDQHKDIQQQKAFYDQYWRELKPIGRYKLERTQWIAAQLAKLSKRDGTPQRLLDLGCGDGRLAPFWQSVTGAETHALELSPAAVVTAQQMFPTVQYKEGDATATGYDSNLFDIIVCQEVLEHIEHQDTLISECHRILNNKGYLILTTPNKLYFDNRKGGNYSTQPIENIIDKQALYSLLSEQFEIISYETLVYAAGDYGPYRRLTNKYWLGILRRLGLENAWKQALLKKGYGLHMAIVCRNK